MKKKCFVCFNEEQCENLNFSLFTDLLRVSCVYIALFKKGMKMGAK